jgi:hypothetical protein
MVSCKLSVIHTQCIKVIFKVIEVIKILAGKQIIKVNFLTDLFRLNFDIFLFYSLLKTNEK